MLSIIIPTLNEEKAIGDTLLSLKMLKDFHYEIIVADGGSKDKTVEIVESHGAKVIIHKDPGTQTISGNRNLGASIASGDFLVFVDAGVIIPNINEFFKKTLAAFENQKKLVGLSVCIRVSPEVETLSDKFFFNLDNYLHFFNNNILGFGSASGKFQMVKAPIFRKLEGYNRKIAVCEDIELFKRLSKEGKTRIELSLHVRHPGRRAHAIGWPKLLSKWLVNGVSVSLFKKSFHSSWDEIR